VLNEEQVSRLHPCAPADCQYSFLHGVCIAKQISPLLYKLLNVAICLNAGHA
jgi:hypothetical protein